MHGHLHDPIPMDEEIELNDSAGNAISAYPEFGEGYSDCGDSPAPQPTGQKSVSVIIIDDDLPSVEVLCDALATYPEVKILAKCPDLEAGRKEIERHTPDLVFLDIEFPGGVSGLDLFEDGMTYPGVRFVFYTVYSKYIHEALKLRTFDYLLKPFDPEEIGLILERFRIEDRLPGITASEVSRSFPLRSTSKQIAITTLTNDRVIVSPGSILFFKYDSGRKIWEVILTSLQRYMLKRHTTAELILSYGSDFVRTHKSYIVNIAYVGLITGNECRLLPPFNDITEIKISKNFKRPLLDRFYDI